MYFSPDIIDTIRRQISLSEVIGRSVVWDARRTQAGRGHFWACCPFHSEKTPSFRVDDQRGRYKCFGCGASGDHFRFLQEMQGIPFAEAVQTLAESAGLPLPSSSREERAREKERASLLDLCAMACQFFESQRQTSEGRRARAFLQARGFSQEICSQFQIGYAPIARAQLKEFFQKQGVPLSDMVAAGLVIVPPEAEQWDKERALRAAYDRFRGRIMIPIHDGRGQVVAFGGRILSDQGGEGRAKYLNSPETSLFSKGQLLFNFHRARQPAFESGTLFIVEGYLDVLALVQAGIPQVVATLGTALTPSQIQLAWKLAQEPILCFDGDKAGQKAACRTVECILPALTSGYSFQFVFLPEGKDPDDLLRSGGKASFLAYANRTHPLFEFLWQRAVQGMDLSTPERKAALEAKIEKCISLIADRSLRRLYQSSTRTRLSRLFWQMERRARRTTPLSSPAALPQEQPRQSPLHEPLNTERALLGLCLRFPELFERHSETIMGLQLSSIYAPIRRALHQALLDSQETDQPFLSCLTPELQPFLKELSELPTLTFCKEEAFSEKCLLHFCAYLSLRALEEEYAQLLLSLKTLSENDAEALSQTEECMIALLQELNLRRNAYIQEENALTEEGLAGQTGKYDLLLLK